MVISKQMKDIDPEPISTAFPHQRAASTQIIIIQLIEYKQSKSFPLIDGASGGGNMCVFYTIKELFQDSN